MPKKCHPLMVNGLRMLDTEVLLSKAELETGNTYSTVGVCPIAVYDTAYRCNRCGNLGGAKCTSPDGSPVMCEMELCINGYVRKEQR